MTYSNGYHRIINIDYGIDDHIVFIDGKNKKKHYLKIYYNKEIPYFNYKGIKYTMDQFFKEGE